MFASKNPPRTFRRGTRTAPSITEQCRRRTELDRRGTQEGGCGADYRGIRRHSRCHESPLKHTQMNLGSSTVLNIQYEDSNYGNQNGRIAGRP